MLTVLRNVAGTAAIDAAVLLGFEYAAEGLRDEVALEGVWLRGAGGRVAGRDGEGVDELEDEETRESAAEVADAVEFVSLQGFDGSAEARLT